MRIAIATVQVPFVTGGAETLSRVLRGELRRRGHEVDVVTIPFKWYPPEALVQSMTMGRMLDLGEAFGQAIDLVIAVKFPAYLLQHPNKILWLCHQHRQAYDLWGTKFGDLHGLPNGEALRQFIVNSDSLTIGEALRVYTISRTVSDRLLRYNGIRSVPLYHLPEGPERFSCNQYGDFIFYPSRLDAMKRQHCLIEAAPHLRSGTRIVIAGMGPAREHRRLEDLIRNHGLERHVSLLGCISEAQKLDLYASCLAVYFGPLDEDYGYVALEAMLSRKPVITHLDSGGPTEFVVDGVSGFVIPPEPVAIATAVDRLASDPALAAAMGEAGARNLRQRDMSWDHVIGALLGGQDG